MKKIIAVLIAAVLIGAMTIPVYAESDVNTKLGVGMSIIGFSSADVVTGETVTSDVLDDVVCTVINEWADWCGPCLGELPHFQAMHEYYSSTPEADVQILGSVYCSPGGTTVASAAALCTSNGYTWHNLVEDNVLAQVFNTSDSIPQTIIVDRHGVVRDHRVGSFSEAQLRSFIEGWYETLLAEEGPSEPGYINGDVNGDEVLDATDALLVLRYSMNLVNDMPNIDAADVNGDGNIDMTDALLILRAALGIIDL